MEKIIVTILMGLLFSITGNAQENYEEEMTRALELWEQGKPEESAELFESIAETEKENWLPYYYAAFVKTITSFSGKVPEKKKEQLAEAQLFLDKAAKYAEEGNMEPMILQATLHMGYVANEPMKYGGQLSPVITDILKKVAEREPQNPRLALTQAEWNIGASSFFGEDPGRYCDDLKESLLLFEKEESKGDFSPVWGEERARILIATTCK